MSYQIQVSKDGTYIIGKITGELTRDTAQQLAKEYAEMIESTGIKRILNDVRGVRDQMSTIGAYDYAYKDVKSIGLPRDIRAAILADEGDRSHHFQETVAHNAGYLVKVFHSFDQAILWLFDSKAC
ncbi:STAS domain-containing protein [Ketobacter alkanivorans]|uniref:STAS/SEC14 domain-containing protein n=1 Tax=Ketobacter alkanivorans TaxID=1917421 RepID=A0A2K9LN78_9GAMM|nr:STAS domain-containing protein [Ketobacter alkanivorans]AUM12935.1 hypothetical protein Kalk_11095 [Ketobacter alkanivorans]